MVRFPSLGVFSMGVPQVVIVGRPNVGKSSIFNWLARKRLAIVDGTAGVTRDRQTFLMCHHDHFFDLVDTGGIGFEDPDLTDKIDEQIEAGIESADVVLFVVDTREGLMPSDQEVARRLRFVTAPVICVANKTDDSSFDPQADEFYRLGRGKLVRVSTLQNRGREELLNMIDDRLPKPDPLAPPPSEPDMKVAIVGRRNVGKSTFVNTLAQAERVITSEIPGTTRDSIDVRFELDGRSFVAIDTPGLKRTRSIATDVEFYSTHRAQRSIRRADVVFMFFDPTQRISKVDKQLCEYISENYKPCIFVVNKWDLVNLPTEKWVTYLRDQFRTMWHVPIAFITGKTGRNVKALLNHGQMLFKQARQRVPTGELNRVIRFALEKTPPPLFHNRRPKIFYSTQVSTEPPTIVLFCNEPRALSAPYCRYLLGVLRDRLPYSEVPIKLYLRNRQSGDTRDEIEPEVRVIETSDAFEAVDGGPVSAADESAEA
jgi:GTP-binding protein